MTMADFLSLALGTGLGPVLALAIMAIMAGIGYKIAGKGGGVVAMLFSVVALYIFNFIPVYILISIIVAVGVIALYEYKVS